MADNKEEKLRKILERFDRDYSAGEDARREAVNDLFFSRISQWDDWLQQYVTLQYRGQFDIVKPVVRKLAAEMRQNPIQVRYRPVEGADPDAADALQGMYRASTRQNSSISAINIAVREMLECGYGAWRWITEYEEDNPLSNNQRARRIPIHEAADCVIWDSASVMMDKSDARHVTILVPYTRDDWKEYAEKEGIDPDLVPDFTSPDNNYEFPWVTSDKIYVAEHYERVEKKETAYIYQPPLGGDPVYYLKSEIKDVIDELANAGYEKIGERRVTTHYVNKYLVSLGAILKGPQRIAGKLLPVTPCYGEWGFAGGKEVYEGVVRGMKDAQRARNTVMSFNMDIVSKSPRKKPVFFPEQIAGFEHMYEGEDDYPYYYMNRRGENGEELPTNPIGYIDNAEIPQANALMLEAATQAIKEVSALGVNAQQVSGQQVAFDTVNQLNQRADMESYIFMDNLATAMRRDGEIFQSICAEIYDVPRTVLVVGEDGTEQEVQILDEIIDYATGERVKLNDITGKFETFVDVGPSYKSQKDANRAELREMLSVIPADNPLFQLVVLLYFTLQDGKISEPVRKYCNTQLVLMGFREPENEEEAAALQQQQQQQQGQEDPNMVLAQAQMVAAQAEAEKAANQTAQTRIKAFTAQMDAQAQQAETVKTLAEARNIDDKAVLEGIKLLGELRDKQFNQQSKAVETITGLMRNAQPQQQAVTNPPL